MTQEIKSKVQATLDQLLREHLIPFKLTAHGITTNNPGEYFIHLYDSRIHSFEFLWPKANFTLDQIVRTAVLAQVAKMHPPLLALYQRVPPANLAQQSLRTLLK